MSDAYYEKKKREGLFFTLHNIDPNWPYLAMDPTMSVPRAVLIKEGPTFWSKLSGRYRTSDEQIEFLKNGCVDVALPRLR